MVGIFENPSHSHYLYLFIYLFITFLKQKNYKNKKDIDWLNEEQIPSIQEPITKHPHDFVTIYRDLVGKENHTLP